MKIILDRIDKDQKGIGVACFEDENGEMLFISEENMPRDFYNDLFVGVIAECELIDGKITSAKILHNETKSREEKMKSKLKNLFNKRKS